MELYLQPPSPLYAFWHVQRQLYLTACLFVVQRSHWLKGLHTVHGQKNVAKVTVEITMCWCYNAEGALSLAVSQKFSSGWLCGDGMCHTNGHVTLLSDVEVDDKREDVWYVVLC